MINWNLVWAVVVRHLYNFRHSVDRASDAFYWPAMDVFLWGFASKAITQSSVNLPGIVVTILSGLILWMIVWRGQYEITVNLLEEMWSQNLVNLFASPLRLREWVVGVFILGFIKMLLTVGFAVFLAWIVYQANIFNLGFYLIPFMISLLLTGWAAGLIVSAVIVYYGTRIQTLAWSGVAIITPFSGVFYPVSTLPDWAQKVSAFLPTSYIFEGMRIVIFKGTLPIDMLVKSFAINFLLLIFGLVFLRIMFEKSKNKSLARLE